MNYARESSGSTTPNARRAAAAPTGRTAASAPQETATNGDARAFLRSHYNENVCVGEGVREVYHLLGKALISVRRKASASDFPYTLCPITIIIIIVVDF